MRRRRFLGLAGAALAAPHIAHAAASRVMRFIPQADIAVVDPIWSSAYVTRNHAFLIFDTLYGLDASLRPQPQMIEGATTEADGRLWRLTLRDGLMFHDGTPVLARDCVASITRWGKRDSFGQMLLDTADEVSADGDKTIVFRLKRPFPLLPDALGKVGSNMLAIMPERLARTDPYKQVTEMVGSGPFRFLPDERVSGVRAAYARFEQYRPRESGTTEWTAGPKIAHFDRVEWNVIPDSATAAAAMQNGEADWWEKPDFDLMPLMRRNPALRAGIVEVTGNIPILRMNQLFAPFDNAAIRRALFGAVDQAAFMQSIAGDDRSAWRDHVGFFTPGTPLASDAGMAALTAPRDPARARSEIIAAGYKGEPVVILIPNDYPALKAVGDVAADMLKRVGFNVDIQATDWGRVVQRRASKAPLDHGGWSVFCTTFSGLDAANPAVNTGLRGNGADAWFGWPTAPKLEALRTDWLAAPDLAAQKTIAEQMQRQAFVDAPYIPLGIYFQPTVLRAQYSGLLQGLPLFWNLKA